jgi:hypothetical protein
MLTLLQVRMASCTHSGVALFRSPRKATRGWPDPEVAAARSRAKSSGSSMLGFKILEKAIAVLK